MTRDQARSIAESLNISIESLRLGLRKGVFPFGTAFQNSSGLWTYVLYPQKVREFIGEKTDDVI